MDLRYIHYITTIARLGSISLAANELFIAQPSLSQRLKRYEDELGHPIFTRTPKGLVLTREGEIFLETARQMERLERSMRQRLEDTSDDYLSGTVVFGLSASRALVLLPLVLPKLKELYPGIKIKVEEGRTKQLVSILKMGNIDLAFMIPPLSDNSVDCQVFTKEEILLAVPKAYGTRSLAHAREGSIPWITLEELSQYPFLLYDDSNRLCDFTRELFLKEGFSPRESQTFKDISVLIGLASAGMGILILPEMFTDRKYNLDYYSIGPKGCFRPLGLAYPPGFYRSRATCCFARLMIDILLEEQKKIRKEYR